MGAVRQELEYELAGLDDEWRANLSGKSADVLFETGLKMYFGIDCSRDSMQAGRWFSHAENFGSADAAYVLRTAYQARNNDATEVEPRNEMDVVFETMQECRNASHGDEGRAKWFLSSFYRVGVELNKNDSRAVQLLEAAAEAGNACAQVDLGMMLLRGEGVSKNSRRAVLLFERAIASGKVRAMEGLAYCHMHGEGVFQNRILGVELYRQAAEAGSSEAKEKLREEAVRKDDSGEGSASASSAVGGNGKDATSCIRAEEGSSKGSAPAGSVVGGNGKDATSSAQAEADYKRGVNPSKASLARGQNVVGERYVFEYVFARNCTGLAELYREAANAGNAGAQYRLGFCYESGSGVEQDYTRAVELYHQAAAGGSRKAQLSLANIYYFGDFNVSRNVSLAMEYYTKAAENGCSNAQARLDELRAQK